MKKKLFLLAVLSTSVALQAAEKGEEEIGQLCDKLTSLELQESQEKKEVEVISMIEAYINGAFKKGRSEGSLQFSNYSDPAIQYDESVNVVRSVLKEADNEVSSAIKELSPMKIQFTLYSLPNFLKVDRLKSLSEYDKLQFQMLRLYDFRRILKSDLPKDVIDGIRKCSTQEEKIAYQVEVEKEQDLEEKINVIENNRNKLGRAMEDGKIDDILAICINDLQLNGASSSLTQNLDDAIIDIENGRVNHLVENRSRS